MTIMALFSSDGVLGDKVYLCRSRGDANVVWKDVRGLWIAGQRSTWKVLSVWGLLVLAWPRWVFSGYTLLLRMYMYISGGFQDLTLGRGVDFLNRGGGSRSSLKVLTVGEKKKRKISGAPGAPPISASVHVY